MYILFSGNREINVARGFGAWDLLLLRIYFQMWFGSVLDGKGDGAFESDL